MASLESFLAKWTDSSGSEKANSQLFFTELCDVLDLPHPSPATNDPATDDYVFERRTFDHVAANSERVRWIDVSAPAVDYVLPKSLSEAFSMSLRSGHPMSGLSTRSQPATPP